jgi:hypothetical protein
MRAAACRSKRISVRLSSPDYRCTTIVPRTRSPRRMRWCSWCSRDTPSRRTWRGRSPGRCAAFGVTKSAMRTAGWRRSVEKKGGVAADDVISEKRLRSIEVLKSQGMSNRAIAHRLGVTENAIRKLIGPSKPAEDAQPTLPTIPTTVEKTAIDTPAEAPAAANAKGANASVKGGAGNLDPVTAEAATDDEPVPMSLDRDAENRTFDRQLA